MSDNGHRRRWRQLERRRPSPLLRKVGDHIGLFEACSTFTCVTACRLAESPKRPVFLEGSDGFVSSPRRFDSYRLERPSCRVGIAPTEDQHLSFTAHAMPVPSAHSRPSRLACPFFLGGW